MAEITLRGNPINTVGDLPAVGSKPSFTVTGTALQDVTEADFAGSRLVLNIFPSLDTGVCAASVRKFNELANQIDNAKVLNVSADLPFAQGRFCGAEGLENVQNGSSFRSTFGADFGVTLADSGMRGLLARAVVVLDEDGTVIYNELVPEIAQQPDYDAALAALG
jgi:thioredoxin-dependent peroxiredoxin